MYMNKMIKISHGPSFPIHMIIFGIFLSLGGVVSVTHGNWYILIGSILFLAGLFLAATHSSTVINPASEKLTEITYSCGFIPFRKTMDIGNYPYLTVTSGNYGYTAHSRGGITTDVENMKYEICLLGRNQRTRLVIQTCPYKQETLKKAKEYADRLGREIVTYHPKRANPNRR